MRSKRNRRKKPLVERLARTAVIGWYGLKGLLKVSVVITLVATVPLGLYFGYHAIMQSSYFTVTAIRIDGNVRVGRAEVLEIAGLSTPRHILTLDTDLIVEQLLENPWVATALVERELPRAVRIEVTEREPAAWIYWNTLSQIDSDGRMIVAGRPADVTLPIITGIEPLTTEEDGDASSSLFRIAMGLVHLYDVHGLSRFDQLSEIHFDELTGFTLLTQRESLEIRLGNDRFSERLERLRDTLETLGDTTLSGRYILLDAEDDLSRVAVGPVHPGRGRYGSVEGM